MIDFTAKQTLVIIIHASVGAGVDAGVGAGVGADAGVVDRCGHGGVLGRIRHETNTLDVSEKDGLEIAKFEVLGGPDFFQGGLAHGLY